MYIYARSFDSYITIDPLINLVLNISCFINKDHKDNYGLIPKNEVESVIKEGTVFSALRRQKHHVKYGFLISGPLSTKEKEWT